MKPIRIVRVLVYATAGTILLSFPAFAELKENDIPDRFELKFSDPSFEEAGETEAVACQWVGLAYGANQKGTAIRSKEKATEGEWSMVLEVASEHTDPEVGIATIGQDKMIEPVEILYDWNSDLAYPPAFRPGMVTGYSLDIANEGAMANPVYLRLCTNTLAGGSQYWGGPQYASTDFSPYVTSSAGRPVTGFHGSRKSIPSGRGASVGFGVKSWSCAIPVR